jgi:hypothetical protein
MRAGAALAERERSAITEIISGTPAEAADATLCMRHLAPALAAGPAIETGQAMLGALAATLRRDTDDMRAYALKREALRSGLVTEEESRTSTRSACLPTGPPSPSPGSSRAPARPRPDSRQGDDDVPGGGHILAVTPC